MRRLEALRRFKKELSFPFKNGALLEEVFVHSSYLNERQGRGLASNERLEFLGDAVLQAVISHLLYQRFQTRQEGELTKLRARLVNRIALARLAKGLGMGGLILLGEGERKGGGTENPTILSGAFEALVAAIYIDGGWRRAYFFVKKYFSPLMDESILEEVHFDYKPRLQEFSQRHFRCAPLYEVVKEEGPQHKRSFTVEVKVKGETLGSGNALRKKDAEQFAAKQALEALRLKGYA